VRFIAAADTDIGTTKDSNQDSLLVKHASSAVGEVLMAIVCDGMGGLSKGELASATVVREFSVWFDKELPHELSTVDMSVIGGKWELMLKDLNVRILEYGKKIGTNLGTTFTGILFINDKYVIAHVGDTRVYYIYHNIKQLTEDQTVIAREISRGTITPEQAKTDSRRNMLLQCVGASKVVNPQIICGNTEKGTYIICSDGFRHKITEAEMYEYLNPHKLSNKSAMHSNAKHLIDLVKKRKERDNISVIIIKSD
jgi:serine/threonine protein phosphatase PrpC